MIKRFTGARTLALGTACAALMIFATTASHAQEKKFIVQGGAPVPYTGFLSIYVGQQGGFFKEEGLEVEMRYASGAPQGTQITAANQADVGVVTVEPTING